MSVNVREVGEDLHGCVGDSSVNLGAGACPALDPAPTLDLALAPTKPRVGAFAQKACGTILSCFRRVSSGGIWGCPRFAPSSYL